MSAKIALYKLVVLGDGGVGKTSMTIQFTLQHFVETYDPTIEDSYRKQMDVDGQNCMIEVLDTAGQEEYTSLRDQWIRGGDGVMLLYSTTSKSSFDRLEKIYHQIQRTKNDDKFPVVVVGNKSDLTDQREVSERDGLAFANKIGCRFMESSAKTCKNVLEAFLHLVREIRRHRTQPINRRLSIDLDALGHPDDSPGKSRHYRSRKSLNWTGNAFDLIKRHVVRQRTQIPTEEGNTEAGRIRLTRYMIQAARNNHEREVRAYLTAGAYPDGQPGTEGAAIHVAAASGHVNIVNLLLKKGAGVNARGPSGVTALQLACLHGHPATVKLLLHKGAQIDQSSESHGTALCAAVATSRTEVVDILLKKGANVNVAAGIHGNALQAAAEIGNVAIIEALHKSGADIDARGVGGCTALEVAAHAGHIGAVRSLLIRGAQVDARGGKYGRALEAANACGHTAIVSLLIEYGAQKETFQRPSRVLSEKSQVSSESNFESLDDWPLSPGLPADLSPISSPSRTWSDIPTLTRGFSPPPLSEVSHPEIHPFGFSTIHDPPDANADIVFIHGLQGHPERTWTYVPPTTRRRSFLKSTTDLPQNPSQTPIFWPHALLSKHPDMSRSRILTWGYNTHVVAEFFGASDQQNITQHGHNLMVALQQERKRDPERPLIFVAHSLGGILIKVALDSSRRSTHQPQYLPLYASTTGIIFLGTPHRGSSAASWGLLASNLAKIAGKGTNDKVLKGLLLNSELLEHYRKVFLQMLEDGGIRIHSFYETRGTLGGECVVPYESAQVGHARFEVVREIVGNHHEICKFGKASDPGYRAVFGAIEDYVQAATGDEG